MLTYVPLTRVGAPTFPSRPSGKEIKLPTSQERPPGRDLPAGTATEETLCVDVSMHCKALSESAERTKMHPEVYARDVCSNVPAVPLPVPAELSMAHELAVAVAVRPDVSIELIGTR